MRMTPKISIVMPVYNVEKYLRECLDSVRAQTFTDWECICVDDGSTDASPGILDEYAASDLRIKVYWQENKGSGIARNRAIDLSKGDFICFMDPDDYYPHSNVFTKLLDTAKETGRSIVGGGMRVVNANGATIRDLRFDRLGVLSYRETQQHYWYQRYLFSSSLIKTNNIRFPELRRRQDPPFFVDAMLAAGEYCAIPDLTYCYREKASDHQIDWLSDNGIRLVHHLAGLELVMQKATAHHLDDLLIKNVYGLTDSRAFSNCAEVACVKEPLKRFVKLVRTIKGKRINRHLCKVARNAFLAEERNIPLKLFYVWKIFGCWVFSLCILAKLKSRVLSFRNGILVMPGASSKKQ